MKRDGRVTRVIEPVHAGESQTPRIAHAALADLAFGGLSKPRLEAPDAGAHLALLSADTLELDLDDPLQRRFGDYELLELIGEGGMGMIYRARQASLDREVAIKLLAAGPWASREFIERFLTEARHAARMHHPNIVTVYEVGTAEELHYFSMRLVRGVSLAGALRRDGPFDAFRAAELMRSVAEAVAYAHSLAVLHLDLKPGNILLDEDGVPYVADFGLARRLDHLRSGVVAEVSGTPSYMAPEQARIGSDPLTPATDIWGLGAILYELVTGEPPFRGESARATLTLLGKGQVRRPRRARADLPLDLEAIIFKCLSKDPAGRYESARALADDLACFCGRRAVQARPLHVWQRVGRLALREPKLAALAMLAFTALLVGVVATTQQWQRAEANAATSNERLWESRRDTAQRLHAEGRGFEALPALLANIVEQERSGLAADPERREFGMVLAQGPTLIDRMVIADAKPLAAALSDDGKMLALGLGDLTVRWYDSENLTERGRVELAGLPTSDGAASAPRLLRFIDSHRLLVTLDWHETQIAPSASDTWLIDLDLAKVVAPPAQFGRTTNMRVSRDGKHALLSDAEDNIQLWQIDPWQPISARVQDPAPGQPWLVGSDARYVVRPGRYSVAVVSAEDLHTPLNRTASAPADAVGNTAIAENMDGTLLALGDARGRVQIVDVSTGQRRQLPTPAGREVSWLAFSEDGQWLAAARLDGAAFVFDVMSGDAVNSGQMQSEFEPRQIIVNHRNRLIVVSGGGETALWRLPSKSPGAMPATRLPASPTSGAREGGNAVALAADAGLLATVDMSGEVRLWRLPKIASIAGTAEHASDNLYFDGQHVVDVAWNQLRVVAYDGTSPTTWIRFSQPIGFAELTADGRSVIASSGSVLHVLDASTLRARLPPVSLRANPMRLAVTADGKTAVLAFGGNGTLGFEEYLQSVDLGSGKTRGEASVPGPLRQLELSADGTRLVAVGPAGDATTVLDAGDLDLVGRYRHNPDWPVLWASFAGSDDRLWLLATSATSGASDDAEIIDWNARSGATLSQRRIAGVAPVGITTVAGRPLVAGRDGDWLDPGSDHERHTPRQDPGDATTRFAVSHDGGIVAHIIGKDVVLYDAATLETIAPPMHTSLGTMEIPWQLAFAPDSRRLLVRSLSDPGWLVFPTPADSRGVESLREDVRLLTANGKSSQSGPPGMEERVRLRERDPGPWLAAEVRPTPLAARWIDGVAVPARPSATSPLMLDLTEAYNLAPGSLNDQRERSIPTGRHLPFGVVHLDGVDYDIRGAVELRSSKADEEPGDDERGLPQQVRGIRVPDRLIAGFHVLLFATRSIATSSTEVYATVRLHYRDGRSIDLPLRTQHEVPGWSGHDRTVPFAWVHGDVQRISGVRAQALLSNPWLENPHPERIVSSLDLVSGRMRSSQPVFLAVTAAPVGHGTSYRASHGRTR